MSHKKVKKTPKIQKNQKAHLISPDLITSKRFKDVVALLQDKSELTNRDRYLYGYSLLQMQQHLNALIMLWPLVSKTQTALLDDCAALAHHVFKDEHFISTEPLSEDTLHTLFLAVKTLSPQHPVLHALKKRLFDSLWSNNNHEKLERILKTAKDKKTLSLVENLGKLAFFQARSKLTGSIPAFVGLVLTGGACLIKQHPMYHADIKEEICALGHEIKILMTQLKTKGSQHLAWDTALIENFIDYEASVLIEVLHQSERNGELTLDIIPTPSYFITYDGVGGPLSQSFLPWLSEHNQSLAELYRVDTQNAVLWALNGDKLSVIRGILKPGHTSQFNPYLRLAIMLRAEYIKKSSLPELIQLSDFETIDETSYLFKNIAVQTAKSILNKTSSIIEIAGFWQMLVMYYPLLEDQELKDEIRSRALGILRQQYKLRESLDLNQMKGIAGKIGDVDLAQQLDIFSERQDLCSRFILNLEDSKQSKKSITAIKSKEALLIHLTLIIDSFSFVYEGESLFMMIEHIHLLVKNRRINKLIPLKELFECNFSCGCRDCFLTLIHEDIPSITKQLNLPIAAFPEVCDSKKQQSGSNMPTLSVLSQPDPFMILDITYTESKPMIMQKMMKLIQHSPDKMASFRQAQSEIFNPGQRFLHHYLRAINHANEWIEADKQEPVHHVPGALKDIPLRTEFINAH